MEIINPLRDYLKINRLPKLSILLNNSFKQSVTFTMILIAIIPESCFRVWKLAPFFSEMINIIMNRGILLLVVWVLALIVNCIMAILKTTYIIMGKSYCISIEYGDLLKIPNCKKVIPFDECFTTVVGDKPEEVNKNSLCGQYLIVHPIKKEEMMSLLKEQDIKSEKSESEWHRQKRYQSGTLVSKNEYLFLAFAKLNEKGLAEMTREEFLNCLNVLWQEIDTYYGQQDVCMPILGSGVTRMRDETLTQQELLDIIIASYKLSPYKIKLPYKLRIICRDKSKFSLHRIGDYI